MLALRHDGFALGHEEGATDLDRGETAKRAQRERHLRLGGEGRVAADLAQPRERGQELDDQPPAETPKQNAAATQPQLTQAFYEGRRCRRR